MSRNILIAIFFQFSMTFSIKITKNGVEEIQTGNKEEERECAICMNPIDKTSDIVNKPCACTVDYCKECWDRSMVQNNTKCPSCRSDIAFDYDNKKGELQYLLYKNEDGLFRGAPKSTDVDGPKVETTDGNGETWLPGKALTGKTKIRFEDEIRERSMPTLHNLIKKRLVKIGEKNEKSKESECKYKCICGGEDCLQKMTWDARVEFATNPQTFDPVCDCCNEHIEEGSNIWSCERQHKSLAHITGLDICEGCMNGTSDFIKRLKK